jgi:hypothetical protein
MNNKNHSPGALEKNSVENMNNHAATYNPSGKKYREQAEKGAIGRTAYLQAKSYEDVFVNAVENRRWGLSRLPPHHSRRGFAPRRGERGRRRERNAVGRGR